MGIDANADPRTGQVGSFYMRISSASVDKTVPVKDANDPEFLVDVDANGKVVGVEVLGLKRMHELCEFIAKHLPKPYRTEVKEYCEA